MGDHQLHRNSVEQATSFDVLKFSGLAIMAAANSLWGGSAASLLPLERQLAFLRWLAKHRVSDSRNIIYAYQDSTHPLAWPNFF